MKANRFIILTGIILIAAVNLNAQMTKTQLQDMYISYLTREGYSPEVGEDGVVVFRTEGLNFYIDVAEEDQEAFRIVFPNFWEIERKEEAKIRNVINYINRTTKVVKVYLTERNDNVWMETQIFLVRPEDFSVFFQRMLDILLYEIDEFVELMEE